MIKVRKGVFETNSSSTHAIVVAQENTEQFDRIDFRIGKFGWECRYYSDPYSKASYFYTLACDALGRDVADDIVQLLSPYGINCTFSEPAVIREYGLENGYVDHCIEGLDFVNDCLNDASLLIDFLFNDESYVETGNDNDDESVGETKPRCAYVEYYKGN